MEYRPGDRLTVTFEGSVLTKDDAGNVFVTTGDGFTQRFYSGSVAGEHVTIERSAFDDGLYQDDGGEVFLRKNGEWFAFNEPREHASPDNFTRIENLPNGQPW